MFSIVAASLIFGLVHPGSKFILSQGLDLMSFCLLYVLIRWLAQLPYILRSGQYRVPQRREWALLVAIGLIGAGLQFCEFKGIASGLAVPLVSFLVYSHPIWSLLFTRLINGERFKYSSLAQVISGGLGIACITGSALWLAPEKLSLLLPPLLAGVLIALWISLSSRAKKSGASAWTISFYYDFFALLALLVLWRFDENAASFLDLVNWTNSPTHIFLMSAYSLLIGLLPNILFYKGCAKTSAQAAGLILLMEPVMSTITSSFVWHDALPSFFFVGTIFILFAGVPMTYLKSIYSYRRSAINPIILMVLILASVNLVSPKAEAADPAAVHGMLVFGDKSIYFSHLPMFHKPHDYQVILQVELGEEGKNIYLNDKTAHPEIKIYTFVPKPMVLPDVVMAKTSFLGDLYRGHFEKDGVLIKESIQVKIVNIIYFQKLNPMAPRPGTLTYLLFGQEGELWLSHLISTKPDFDQVLKLETALNNNYVPPVDGFFTVKVPNAPADKALDVSKTYSAEANNNVLLLKNFQEIYLEFDDLSM